MFLVLLLLAFGGLITWVALARQVVFRVIAACLAFIPAMVFGIAAVNKYYDYYQTWGALYNDLSGQTTSIPHLTAAGLGKGTTGSVKNLIAGSSDAKFDAQYGLDFYTTIAGRHSRISRQALIYLPPQYFSKAYANYKFPVIELLHGEPGEPSAWVNVMNVVPIYLPAMASGKAAPAVLVMPDTDGGQQYGLQCLNDTNGLQDMTYVAQDVPDWVVANLRVQKSGRRGASPATRRAATALPTSRCSIRTCSAMPGRSAATSRRLAARCRRTASPAASRSTSSSTPTTRSCWRSTRPTST